MLIAIAAAMVSATPATFGATVAAAQPGDTLVLAAGDYGAPRINGRSWSPPLTIDARQAHFSGLTLSQVEGLTFNGGQVTAALTDKLFTPAVIVGKSARIAFRGTRFEGPGASGVGLNFRLSNDIVVAGASITGFHRGIVVNEVTGGTLSDIKLSELRSDGIDIAASHSVTVERIECSNFKPVAPDHPDCVQLWSTAGKPPTSDIIIRDSRATGDMQGFSGFNHVRAGIDDGGFDRITITGNVVRNNYPSGVSLYNARDSVVTGNDVAALPGARYWTQVHIEGVRTKVENNRVAPRPAGASRPRYGGRE